MKTFFLQINLCQTSESESESEDNNLSNMHEAHSNLDYWMFKLKKYVREYPSLYFNLIDAGYKCKICKMFPPLSSTGDNARLKFANKAVKSLTDHPRRFLDGHQIHLSTLTPQNNAKVLFHSTADSN